MTKKKQRFLAAKNIRRITGLKLPLAVKAAKLVAHAMGGAAPKPAAIPPGWSVDTGVLCPCGLDGCTRTVVTIPGPRGTFTT